MNYTIMEPLSFEKDFLPLKNLSRNERITGMCKVLIRALNLKNLEVVIAIILSQRSIIHRSYLSSTGEWVVAKYLEDIGNPEIFKKSLISYIRIGCYLNGWFKMEKTYYNISQTLQALYLNKATHNHGCGCSLCLLAHTACNISNV